MIRLKAQESLSEKERMDLDALCALHQHLTKSCGLFDIDYLFMKLR